MNMIKGGYNPRSSGDAMDDVVLDVDATVQPLPSRAELASDNATDKAATWSDFTPPPKPPVPSVWSDNWRTPMIFLKVLAACAFGFVVWLCSVVSS